jgi:hypothetical protein
VQYLFQHPMPVPWLLADILTILVTLLVGIFIVRKSHHPVVAMLECFGFVFLYASIYENFAVVQGWYVYGRSLLMIGDVPLSVPLLEMDVLVTGLWLLEKMEIPGLVLTLYRGIVWNVAGFFPGPSGGKAGLYGKWAYQRPLDVAAFPWGGKYLQCAGLQFPRLDAHHAVCICFLSAGEMVVQTLRV